jgi:tRNA(Ile)-lysidine synthase
MTARELREHVRVGGLLTGESPVVAMLSGGRDSVCLLDVAAALLGPERVRALHVNYGLRAGSDGDEHHCRELCERLGVEIEVVRAQREHGASGNLHAWARELRYRAALDLARRLDGRPVSDPSPSGVGESALDALAKDALGARAGTAVATGHTASDQVETILYRLAASPGRRALLGMSAREGRLVRPFLGLPRSATGDYCRERQLAWREDESNDREQYARARVRHGLLVALDAVHPAAQANVLRTAELLREESGLLDALVQEELQGREGISIERLRELHPALARLIVIHLAERAAGTFVPQAGERVAEILVLGERGGRAELHVGGLAAAVVEGGELRMIAIQPREQH